MSLMNSPIAENDELGSLFSKDPHTRQIETVFLVRLDGWIRARPDDPEVLLSLLDLINHLAPTSAESDVDPPRRSFTNRGREDPTT
ncbi:MAG: hypothetical protein SF172_15155 [Burkholderiales bacterium]|nr:hypothetical protein [Burkholderiales bacterium]